ncbi:MAG: glycosyltransferase family 2 protein [Candidatus Caenarcaniphilales bacterium]|nr:glycosyltransferase family 2 protein [Candidatus Caenarcaniphilales bacterium]
MPRKKDENLLHLSIFIICKDEAHIIGRTLEQACKLAKEVIVVDSGSEDDTFSIATKYANKVYLQEWQGYAAQKNYALSLCRNKWVLSLDADEIMTDELIEEIREFFKSGKYYKYLGFRLPRRLYIGSKFVKWGGFYPDYQLRLFLKDLGRFQELPVHESVEILDEASGEYITKSTKLIYDFENPLDHYSYATVGQLEATYMKYASLSHKKTSKIWARVKAAYTFVYKFLIRAGLFDGKLGLQLAIIYAKYTFKKYQ